MRDLTLDQVQEAGRFAWCEVRSPAETRGGPDDYREDWTRRENGEMEVEVIGNNAFANDTPPVPGGGWHHADGCDRPYCKEA